MKLRQWQTECINQAFDKYCAKQEHFLCLATPGAGKTIMASVLAERLFKAGMIDLVICFSPSIIVAEDFKEELELYTGKRLNGAMGAAGCSTTYQGMLTLGQEFWELLDEYRVFVIFDEIHHCSGSNTTNANAWGERIIANIQGKASYTLALTGTPWRSDQTPVVLANYCNENNKVRCNFTYGLRQAVSDQVCRVPAFTVIDNDSVMLKSENKLYKSFQSLLQESKCTYQELLENEALISYCLKQANLKLNELRRSIPDAGGLIIATSILHANKISAILESELGEHADIATYDVCDALSVIRNYKHANSKWIISVGMISEGTNIPRLQVCCHLTRVKTELYFRQILGRVLRIRNLGDETGYLFMPAEPTLIKYAQRVSEDVPDTAIINLKSKIKNEKSPRLPTYPNINKGEFKVDINLEGLDDLQYSNYRDAKFSKPKEGSETKTKESSDLFKIYAGELNISGLFINKLLTERPL